MYSEWIQRLFWVGAGARNLLYDLKALKSERLPVPIISVGNLSWGGTGKTEFVKLIARRLQASNLSPLVVSRGYRCKGAGVREISPEDWDCDEPAMLKTALPGVPVYIGRRREEVIWRALKEKRGIKVVILDDGFQYRRLQRDLDIVLITPGIGWMREPLPSLRRAGVVVINKVEDEGLAKDLARRVERYCPLVVASRYELRVPEGVSSGIAVCGIARPESFFRGLEDKGVEVKARVPFGDHHRYSGWDVRRIISLAKEYDVPVLTTLKDWVKLRRFSQEFSRAGVKVARVEVEVRFLWGQEAFWDKVMGVVRWTRYGGT